MGVIEAFILREGTDYGATEAPFEDKVDQVFKQLQHRDATVVFDPDTQTCTIVTQKSMNPTKRSHT